MAAFSLFCSSPFSLFALRCFVVVVVRGDGEDGVAVVGGVASASHVRLPVRGGAV